MKTMKNLPDVVLTSAVFSPCQKYRYFLRKSATNEPDVNNTCLWIMLNPSTATPDRDDPTVRKCQEFARRWGKLNVEVVNLFGLRSTDPRGILAHDDPVGVENINHIHNAIIGAGLIIVAWGSFKHPDLPQLASVVHGMVQSNRKRPMCLGINKDNMPKHPLYVSYKAGLRVWKGVR